MSVKDIAKLLNEIESQVIDLSNELDDMEKERNRLERLAEERADRILELEEELRSMIEEGGE